MNCPHYRLKSRIYRFDDCFMIVSNFHIIIFTSKTGKGVHSGTDSLKKHSIVCHVIFFLIKLIFLLRPFLIFGVENQKLRKQVIIVLRFTRNYGKFWSQMELSGQTYLLSQLICLVAKGYATLIDFLLVCIHSFNLFIFKRKCFNTKTAFLPLMSKWLPRGLVR